MRLLNHLYEKYWSVLVFAIATPLYLFHIDYGDLWNDEAFTKQVITFPLSDMVGLLAGDFHPPLYFIALKAVTALVGSTASTLRLFSVLGVLATLVLVCTMGKRVLGRDGAFLCCLMIMSIPMMATYAHTARMYTWAAFSVTGMFLTASALSKAPSRRDLLWLGGFTLLGAYVHYYCLLAACCGHGYVLTRLVVTKNRLWRRHLLILAALVVLYLPWLATLLHQVARVKADFYIPPLTVRWVSLSYLMPFFHNYYPMRTSWPLALAHMTILVASVVLIFRRKESTNQPALLLSLVLFHGTILLAIAISLLVRPILLYRYSATIVTMLAVPPALFFVELRQRLVKGVLLAVFVGTGIYSSIDAGKDSLGAYQAALRFLKQVHPDVRKIVHISELTGSTFAEYNDLGPWEQFWLETESTVQYTNMKAFRGLRPVRSLKDAVQSGERFCLADFPAVPLNRKNLDLIMRQSRKLGVDTVADDKVAVPTRRPKLALYYLQYLGEPEVQERAQE
jgi:hypothetical protein